MHLLLGLTTILAVWKWSDWRNWAQYHNTMLFVAFSNLLYNFICASYYLWRLEPDVIPNYFLIELTYTLIVFPGTALLFLSNYPTKPLKQVLHILKFVFIYFSAEWIIGVKMHRISYHFGWHLGWSLIFLLVMFPMIRLHYKNPLVAYLLTSVITVALILHFNIPIETPIEERSFP